MVIELDKRNSVDPMKHQIRNSIAELVRCDRELAFVSPRVVGHPSCEDVIKPIQDVANNSCIMEICIHAARRFTWYIYCWKKAKIDKLYFFMTDEQVT